MARQVEYLPEGWEWRSKGQETWTTSLGRQSTERHAVNIHTGETLSLRQVQNRQRSAKIQEGQEIPPTIRRVGKTRTIYGNYTPGSNTKAGQSGSLYNPEEHGVVKTIVFTDIESAYRHVLMEEDITNYMNVHLQIRYTERLVSTTKTGSDKVGQKNGYATITPFRTGKLWTDAANNLETQKFGTFENPWLQAVNNLRKYDMTGEKARVYLVLKAI